MIRFIISGKRFEAPEDLFLNNNRQTGDGTTLSRFASTSENERADFADFQIADQSVYYFQKSSAMFKKLLGFYASGLLHLPIGMCEKEVFDELSFWGIPLNVVCKECLARMRMNSTVTTTDHHNGKLSISKPIDSLQNSPIKESQAEADAFKNKMCAKSRRILWKIVDDPTSSRKAKIFCGISSVAVLTSVFCMILGSVSALQKSDGEPVDALQTIEIICVLWFTLEFLTRFVVTADKCAFFKGALNIIDLASILPFYIEHSLLIAHVSSQNVETIKGPFLALRLLRILRVARILKLARYSGGMTSFGRSLKASMREIGMLGMFMATTVLMFSTTVYFFEKDEPETKFRSIPHTFWWCIVTMTTVGYGDMIPITVGGKLVASLTTISGVVVLAFPITMIVDNFSKEYRKKDLLAPVEIDTNISTNPMDITQAHSVAIV